MDISPEILIVAGLSALLTFFLISRMIELIPYNIFRSWQYEVENFDLVDLNIENFKINVGYRIALTLVSTVVVGAVLYKAESVVEGYGFSSFFMIMILIVGINIKHKVLPDILQLPMIWCGLLYHSFLGHDTTSFVTGAVVAYLIPFTIYWILKILTGKECIGHGDFKMFALLGAWFGIEYVPTLSVLIAAFILLGLVIGVFRKDKSAMGTGVYYLAASIFAYFTGVFV